MKQYRRKMGDVFKYQYDNKCRYLQYIGIDELQLSGDVVRIFAGEFPSDDIPSIDSLLSSPVDFYCITYVINCVKFGHWEKIGNSSNIGDYQNIKFRCAADFGDLVDGEPIKTSDDWYVWRLGDTQIKEIGKLTGEWKTADIGVLLPPNYINERMREGSYNFIYPEPL